MQAPSREHMTAVYRILRYLKKAPGKGFLFAKKDSLDIKGYTDVDWAGDQTTRRSRSGYFIFVGDNLVTWRSKKQKSCSKIKCKSRIPWDGSRNV